jgi:hypothetical protein
VRTRRQLLVVSDKRYKTISIAAGDKGYYVELKFHRGWFRPSISVEGIYNYKPGVVLIAASTASWLIEQLD